MSIQLNTECFVSEKPDILDKVAPDSERNKYISIISHTIKSTLKSQNHNDIKHCVSVQAATTQTHPKDCKDAHDMLSMIEPYHS